MEHFKARGEYTNFKERELKGRKAKNLQIFFEYVILELLDNKKHKDQGQCYSITK